MLDILETVNKWLKNGQKVALATVIDTWGSAPRRSGSKMAITEAMGMIGSVSGGCVETAVVEQALEVLADGKPRLLKYGVSDDDAWEVGLTCGGKISIFVERLDVDWWNSASYAERQDRAATTFTILEGDFAGRKLLVDVQGKALYTTLDVIQPLAFDPAAYAKTQQAEIAGMNVLVDVHRPRPHLILIGGVHIAQPLQSFARQLGFRVSVIDPRGVFATRERFPDVEAILTGYPDKTLPQLNLDRDTFIAVLTHDPKIDDKALIIALPLPVAYIGVLSSRKTHEARIERLRKAGIAPELIARIHTPIGVEIEARTPEEIALSIMAEIIAVRNQAASQQRTAEVMP
jgi:xanthine dehydrogenase accessory factor